jgi:hypothetical protein
MNDLYLETAKPNREDEENGRADIECSGCAAPLNIFDDEVVVVSTADDPGEPYCDKCAEKVAKAFPGNIHDRREDAEALLRETADTLHEALAPGALAHSEIATRLSTLAARMVRR